MKKPHKTIHKLLKYNNLFPQPVAQLVAVENFYETLTVL
jgi:hypothetical protein